MKVLSQSFRSVKAILFVVLMLALVLATVIIPRSEFYWE